MIAKVPSQAGRKADARCMVETKGVDVLCYAKARTRLTGTPDVLHDGNDEGKGEKYRKGSMNLEKNHLVVSFDDSQYIFSLLTHM